MFNNYQDIFLRSSDQQQTLRRTRKYPFDHNNTTNHQSCD